MSFVRIKRKKADKHDKNKNNYMKARLQKNVLRGSFEDYVGFRSRYSSDGMCRVALALQPLAFSLDLAIAN